MRVETFFEKFDLFADAPDAVAKMRELVLRLAFSGGLSGKNTNGDSPTSSWEQRTIESICSSLTPGFACSRSHQVEDGHVHLRTHNISTLGTLNFDLLVRIDPKMVDPLKSSLRSGDILFNNTNSQELVGKSALVDRDYDYGFSNHLTRLRLKDDVYPGFVVYYLTLLRNSGYFAKLCTRWINQAAVNTETLKSQSIPLPPHAEQKRIVAKVDELMALCDRLEEQQQERETRHAALARASLARFCDAPTPANLDLLFHKSYSIPPADLGQSILTLGVQGQLVPHDPGDESGVDLLERIRHEKEHLVRVGILTRSRYASVKQSSRCKAQWPASWAGVTLGEIAHKITDGTHQTPTYVESGVPFVSVKDFSAGKLDFSRTRFISADEHTALYKRCDPRRGDILIGRIGTLGKAVVVEDDREFSLFVSVGLIRCSTQFVVPQFLRLVLNSSFVDEQFQSIKIGGATHTNKLNLGDLYDIELPLPPLAEQRRIVAKVNELTALVDAMATQIAASHTAATLLMEAAVTELTT